MTQRLYMETTRIPAQRTAGEIMALLGDIGSTSVLVEYKPDRSVEGISFRLSIDGHVASFRLPIRTEPIEAIFRTRRRRQTSGSNDHDQAERVAWRQALRWLQAQLAFIESGMVQVEEVFLPYLMVSPTQTLYEQIESKGFKALPEPSGNRGGSSS